MTLNLTSADNGRTCKLRAGEEIVVHLPENPSTGYRWAVDAADAAIVEVTEGAYASTSQATGGGGEAEFQVKARAPGTAQFKLKRWRPWAGDSSVVERFEVTLQIAP